MFSGSPRHRHRLPRINLGSRHIPLPHPAATESLKCGRALASRVRADGRIRDTEAAPTLQSPRKRRWFVAAFQNRVVQIGRVNLARIEPHCYPLSFRIGNDVAHTFYSQERLAQLAHAFVAIFSLGCYLNCFYDRLITVQRNERVCWIRIVWPRWVHSLYSTRAGDCPAVPRARAIGLSIRSVILNGVKDLTKGY